MWILISLKYFCCNHVSGCVFCYGLWRERLRWGCKGQVFQFGSRGLGSRWRQIFQRGDTEAQSHSLLFPPQIYALSCAVEWRVSSTVDWEMFPSALVHYLNVVFLVCYLKWIDTVSLIFTYRLNTKLIHSHCLAVFTLPLRWYCTQEKLSRAEKDMKIFP